MMSLMCPFFYYNVIINLIRGDFIMAKSQNLEAFWEQNDGKLIKGYGKWLIAYGILLGLISAFFLVVLRVVLFYV